MLICWLPCLLIKCCYVFPPYCIHGVFTAIATSLGVLDRVGLVQPTPSPFGMLLEYWNAGGCVPGISLLLCLLEFSFFWVGFNTVPTHWDWCCSHDLGLGSRRDQPCLSVEPLATCVRSGWSWAHFGWPRVQPMQHKFCFLFLCQFIQMYFFLFLYFWLGFDLARCRSEPWVQTSTTAWSGPLCA
jgi:hypothetical protein